MQLTAPYADTALRIQEVCKTIGLSRSSVYGKLNPRSGQYDKHFPKPFKIGVKAIAWSKVEVMNWLAMARAGTNFQKGY